MEIQNTLSCFNNGTVETVKSLNEWLKRESLSPRQMAVKDTIVKSKDIFLSRLHFNIITVYSPKVNLGKPLSDMDRKWAKFLYFK